MPRARDLRFATSVVAVFVVYGVLYLGAVGLFGDDVGTAVGVVLAGTAVEIFRQFDKLSVRGRGLDFSWNLRTWLRATLIGIAVMLPAMLIPVAFAWGLGAMDPAIYDGALPDLLIVMVVSTGLSLCCQFLFGYVVGRLIAEQALYATTVGALLWVGILTALWMLPLATAGIQFIGQTLAPLAFNKEPEFVTERLRIGMVVGLVWRVLASIWGARVGSRIAFKRRGS